MDNGEITATMAMADTEKCPECDFAWIKGSTEAHAEGCSRHFREELDTRFTYHRPTAHMVENFEILRGQARGFAVHIMLTLPDCRERSVAIRKLEEAVMWANAGLARRS